MSNKKAPKTSQEARTEDNVKSPMVLEATPVKIVTEQRAQSNQILNALTSTAVALSGKEGGVAQVEIMERLWAMQKQAEDRQAEREFGIAKVALAMDLPPIPKNHSIEYIDKNKVVRNTPYADRGDIEGVLDPLCRKHGFSKEYTTETIDGKACQVLVVRHVSGHKEVYRSPYMPLDSTGNKNNNQAAGSTAEYGKRYALVGAFNVIGVDRDDDGSSSPSKSEGDKFTERVKQEAEQSEEKKSLTLEEAVEALETKIRNSPREKRLEIFTKHTNIIEAMRNDVRYGPKADILEKLCEEVADEQ